MNGENNFNNPFNNNGFNNSNNGFNNSNNGTDYNNQNNGFNNSNTGQGNMMNQNNGFNNQNNGFNNPIPQNNFNQQQGQFQNGPMPMPMNNQPNNGQNKKKAIGIIVGVVVGICALGFIFSSSGNKTLTCSRSDTLSGMNYSETVNVYFKNNKVKSLKARFSYDLGSYASQKDLFVEALEESFEDEEDFTYDIRADGDKIIVDISASNDDGVEEYISSSANYDDVKEDLEEEGYTCK